MEATIKLFKALPVENTKKAQNKELHKKTIPYGFIFAPEVIANYSDYDVLISLVRKTIGISAKEINSSFHKSWAKVRDTDMEQLVVEQLAHYLTTYGKESPIEYLEEKEVQWGVPDLANKVANLPDVDTRKILSRDANYVYIPNEVLKIPNLKLDSISLVVIKGYTKDELKEKLLQLLSGIALKEDTIKSALEVAKFVELEAVEVEEVKNKEAKVALYDYLGLVPSNPVEFLRYVVFKTTGTTLLIKNTALIGKIKQSEHSVYELFYNYMQTHGLERLAEIFYRFKPLFLAFKREEDMKPLINAIRRLAVHYHKPMPQDYLNNITGNITNIKTNQLKAELANVNTFRKIRLAYALKFRTKDADSILYRIRNGKSYATCFDFNNHKLADELLDVVLYSIVKDIKKNVLKKKIYIPDFIEYSLPATEKQFTGNFPSGTSVKVSNDMIVGVYWNDVGDNRIDLDLSLMSADQKFGWDGCYRGSLVGDVLFSGDMTSAKYGASELFYVKNKKAPNYIIMLNYYNYGRYDYGDKAKEIEVPFKIIVAKEKAIKFGMNYMVNPNNIVAVSNTVANKRQKILGIMTVEGDNHKFYFAESDMGVSRTSRRNEASEHSRKFLVEYYTNTINLKDVLVRAGAVLVEKKEEAEIDLSPETIDKNSILSLLTK